MTDISDNRKTIIKQFFLYEERVKFFSAEAMLKIKGYKLCSIDGVSKQLKDQLMQLIKARLLNAVSNEFIVINEEQYQSQYRLN